MNSAISSSDMTIFARSLLPTRRYFQVATGATVTGMPFSAALPDGWSSAARQHCVLRRHLLLGIEQVVRGCFDRVMVRGAQAVEALVLQLQAPTVGQVGDGFGRL